MNSEASKSQTVDTVCNISECVEVEAVVDPTDNTSRDIIAEPQVSSNSESARSAQSRSQNYNKSQTEYIKKVSETNTSVLSASVTEVSSFYDISYCSKV